MQRAKLLFALSLIAASCAEPTDEGFVESVPGDGGPSTGGKGGGGRGGTSGTATGGTGGTSGKGGSSGAQTDGGAKDGGTSGRSGAGGVVGTGGSAGKGGTGGTVGTTGAAGTGGTVGMSGMGGASTGGAGGMVGLGGGSTGGSGGAPPTSAFIVQYQVEERNSSGTAIGSQLWIFNNGTASVNMNDLKLRYYVTNEVTAPLLQRINWGNVALGTGPQTQIQGEITITTAPLPTAAPGADSYVEIGFNSGRMLGSAQRIQFSWTVHNNGSQSFNQTNDYSFNAAMTAPSNWDKVVLTQAGNVVWGVTP